MTRGSLASAWNLVSARHLENVKSTTHAALERRATIGYLDVFSLIARDIRNFGFKIPTDDHDRISPPALQKISCEIKFVNVSDKKVMSKMTKLLLYEFIIWFFYIPFKFFLFK